MRGKPFILKALSWVARITPAGAGKTGVFVGNLLEGQDHPRRCGENAYQYILSPLSAGSPPQVRGKRTPHQTKTKPIGITPAGAGKTVIWQADFVCNRDHPRRCGENFVPSLAHCGKVGSPPQVRGKRKRRHFAEVLERITPAGAGKTCLPRRFRRTQHGSPPQVRGKPSTFRNKPFLHRITPAGAGKTLIR